MSGAAISANEMAPSRFTLSVSKAMEILKKPQSLRQRYMAVFPRNTARTRYSAGPVRCTRGWAMPFATAMSSLTVHTAQ